MSLGRERIVGRAAWRIFRFVSLFSVCVFAVVSRGFLAGSCCRNENVLPAASRAGFRIPAAGDRRFVGLFGGLLAFIRFFLPKVLRCRLTDGFRSWNCGQAMHLPYARRGNDGRRRVLSRNRPRLFCAMAGLAPCLFSVRDRLVRTCPRSVADDGAGCLGIFRLRRSPGRLDGETVERPAGSARIASSHDGAGPERAMDSYILQRTEHVRIRNFKRPLAAICGHKLPIRLGFYWAGPLRRKGAAYGKAGNIGNSKTGTIQHIIGEKTKIAGHSCGRRLLFS